jgi:antitoxin component YwqK of YwqJK toxin-antitoxin module
MKKIYIILLALVVFTGGYFVFDFSRNNTETVEALSLIPRDAIYIVQADDPISNWRNFSQSPFWVFLKDHPGLAEITGDANYLDTLIDDNNRLFKQFGKREFYMSAHLTRPNDYDFLFLVDLQKASKIDLLPTILKLSTDKEAFILKEKQYKDYVIIDLYDKSYKDHLYLAQVKNFLICTYSEQLMQDAIDQHLNEDYVVSLKFTEVQNRVDDEGLARLYINYEYLDNYIKLYTSVNASSLEALSSSFSYTGLDMKMDDEELNLQGFTSLPDSVDQYSKLLQKYGNAEFEFDQVISARTAYLQAIGINKFKEFYHEVIKLRSTDPESVAEYNSMKQKVEKVLGLSLEKDILAWIGNEIVIAQNNPSSIHRNEDDLLVAIKAYNVDFAKEKLLLIQKAIKRRTPARFKKMKYKTNDIYYLDIKGFFGLFFGKAFEKLTKPYYTIVGDYILFTTSPKTLVSAVEDYANGYVLAKTETAIKVKENLPDESVLFTYINGPLAYPVLGSKMKPAERADYRNNKPYITYFKGIGLSYTAQGDGFNNNLYFSFQEDEEELLPTSNAGELAQEYLEDYSVTLRNLSEAETFVLKEVNDGKFVKYFKGTEIIQLQTETRNGLLHGEFLEFYIDGTIRSEGKYRKGRKVGRWKYYTISGELSEKTWEGI